MNEQWVPVRGWEGLYEVSDQGRVRSLPRVRVIRSDGRKRVFPGRILVGGLCDGYRIVNFRDGERHESHRAHVLVLTEFKGPPGEGMECCHNNGIRDDNRLTNLRWGTSTENAEDKRKHGTLAIGERQGNAILTTAQVLEIRQRKQTIAEQAAHYGVSVSLIRKVRWRQAWRHI